VPAASSRSTGYVDAAQDVQHGDQLKEHVSAIGFYAAAAVRFLEREDPQVEQALAGLRRLADQTRLAAEHFR